MSSAPSPQILAFIKRNEGYAQLPVAVGEGLWRVGHGHLRRGPQGAPLSPEAAARQLATDVAWAARAVREAIRRPMTDAEFDALTSFAFSIGARRFAATAAAVRFNAGDVAGAAAALAATPALVMEGRNMDGFRRRRATEAALLAGRISLQLPQVQAQAQAAAPGNVRAVVRQGDRKASLGQIGDAIGLGLLGLSGVGCMALGAVAFAADQTYSATLFSTVGALLGGAAAHGFAADAAAERA